LHFKVEWAHIDGAAHPDTSVRHLDLAFLRRMNAAAEEYSTGRGCLLRYIEGVEAGEHRLGRYLAALTHLEQCLSALWQAAELFNRMEQKVLGTASNNLTLYNKGDNSDLERINKLNNVAKHFSAIRAEQTSSPIWITNAGLKCAEASLSFDEIYDNLMALSEVARQTFVEIPREAHARRQHQGSTPAILGAQPREAVGIRAAGIVEKQSSPPTSQADRDCLVLGLGGDGTAINPGHVTAEPVTPNEPEDEVIRLAQAVARLTPADRNRLTAELRSLWSPTEPAPAWKKSGP
jgi:hypothetical protein